MTQASRDASAGIPQGGGRWKRILGVVVLGMVIAFALLVAFPPIGPLKNQIARLVGEEIGRTVTIGGGRLVFRPDLHLELDDVTVSNPPGMTGPDLFRTGKVKAEIRLWPLLRGETDIVSIDLVAPEFILQVDAEGRNNWQIETRQAAGTQAVGPQADNGTGGLILPHTASIENGKLSYISASSGSATTLEEIAANGTIDRTTGAGEAKGRFSLKHESLTFAAAIENIMTAADARPSNVKLSVDGRYVRASMAGEAISSDTNTAFAGDLEASSPSLVEMARWLGANATPSGEPLKGRIAGKIKATPSNVQFIGAETVLNETSATLDGNLDLTGPTAKFQGNVVAQRLDLTRILGLNSYQGFKPLSLASEAGPDLTVTSPWSSLMAEIEVLEQGGGGTRSVPPDPEAMAAAAAAATPGAWSDQPITFGALKVLDLDVLVKADQIAYGGLDLRNGEFKTVLANGQLEAKIERLDVGAGKAAGTVNVDSLASPPRLAAALTMTDVAAEPIITELTGKPLLSGTSNVDLSLKAIGQNLNQLAATVEGQAKFRMGNGALRGYEIRGFDFWEMLTSWQTILKFDLAKKTPFERLDAQYDIKSGIMKSSPGLDVDGSQVVINSTGNVNLPKKRISQKLRVKVLPPPTTFSLPVLISGEWAKPAISIDWGAWFAAPQPSGDLTPHPSGEPGVAPAAGPPTPPELQAAIKRLLSSNVESDRLTEEGKAVLRSLLPPDGGSPPTAP